MTEYILHNEFMELSVIPLGAIIRKLTVKAKDNQWINVVCGYEHIYDYSVNNLYLGATVGRVAGRISNGEFTIDGEHFQLYQSEGVHLHGGRRGFDAQTWDVVSYSDTSITLSLQSPDGDEGYPGNLKVMASFTLKGNQLVIEYSATTDAPTMVNLTNHAYFNLNGRGTIKDHYLQLCSDHYLEFDKSLLPTGKLLPVKGSHYDYRTPKPVAESIEHGGLDNCFVSSFSRKYAATLYSPQTGIEMKVMTNQPAIVVYTPKAFDHRAFIGGAIYQDFPAICLETQNYSDAPGRPEFPSAELHPGEEYFHQTTLEFDVR